MTKPSASASDYDLARALMDRIERDGAVHLDSLAAVCMTHRVVAGAQCDSLRDALHMKWLREKAAQRAQGTIAPPYGLVGEEEVSE